MPPLTIQFDHPDDRAKLEQLLRLGLSAVEQDGDFKPSTVLRYKAVVAQVCEAIEAAENESAEAARTRRSVAIDAKHEEEWYAPDEG
jgi:hypothetical protein